jgi:hypothetical protein
MGTLNKSPEYNSSTLKMMQPHISRLEIDVKLHTGFRLEPSLYIEHSAISQLSPGFQWFSSILDQMISLVSKFHIFRCFRHIPSSKYRKQNSALTQKSCPKFFLYCVTIKQSISSIHFSVLCSIMDLLFTYWLTLYLFCCSCRYSILM